MGLADIVLDNPILVKHVRSRLRPGQVLPGAAIVLVLGACIAWTGGLPNRVGESGATIIVLGLQILILAIGGSNQITTSLGGARESGLLNFHRVSPLPPSVVALGFFLGAPIREYVLVAITLPFALFSAFQIDETDPWKGLLWLGQLEVALLATTWVIHLIAMLGCLTRKKPRGSIVGMILSVLLLLYFGTIGSIGFFYGARRLLDEPLMLNFFGRMIPWLAWLLIYEAPLLGFLGLAAARKMRAERTHSYTKAQSLACMTTLTVLVLGGLWGIARLLPTVPPYEPTQADVIMLATVYAFALAAMVLTATITPTASSYIKGVRRAGHEGRRRPSPWSDAGSNRLALFALCAMVLAGASAVVNVVGRQPLIDPNLNNWANYDQAFVARANLSDAAWLESRQAILSRPIVIAVLTVAYVGLGLQYFSLRNRRTGMALMVLFLFLAWLAPLLTAAAIGMSGPAHEKLALVILALSPLAGIGLSTGFGSLQAEDAIRLAAMAPPITFAFLFKYLVVVAQRKIDRELNATEKVKAEAAAKPPGLPIEVGEPA